MGEPSETVRKRKQAARDIQRNRFSKIELSTVVANADMRVGEIRQFCRLQACPAKSQCSFGEPGRRDEGDALSLSKCQSLMRAAMTQLNLSARAHHGILNLARRSAELAGCKEIQSVYLTPSFQQQSGLGIR